MTVSHFSFFLTKNRAFHIRISIREFCIRNDITSFSRMVSFSPLIIVQLSWCLPTLPRLRGKKRLACIFIVGIEELAGYNLKSTAPSSYVLLSVFRVEWLQWKHIVKRTMINTFEISGKCFIKILNYWKSHDQVFSKLFCFQKSVIKLFSNICK